MKQRSVLLIFLVVITLLICQATALIIPEKDGLVAYYSFDDGSATDNSVNSYDGTINGATVTDGVSGKALYFDGNDKVTLPFLFSSNPEARQVTLVAFVNLSENIPSESFINTGDPEIGMGLSSDGHVASGVKMGDNNWHVVIGGSNVPLDEWIMVTTTLNKDTTTYQVYLNGVLDGTSTIPDINYWHVGLTPAIGAHMWAGGTNFVVGDIDEVMIYNRTLTVLEISNLYNLYIGSPCSIVGTWDRTDGADIYTFYEDGTGQTTFGGQTHHCIWINQGGVYTLTWDFGPNAIADHFIDTVSLSTDCNSFSGTNNYGNTVSAVRVASNHPAVACDDSYNVNQGDVLTVPSLGVLSNDVDPEGDPLTASCISSPINGDLLLNADGSFTYTPLPEWYGNITFTYKANDGIADSNEAQVWITVNKAPIPSQYVINATVIGDGNITPSGEITVLSGGSKTFEIQGSKKSWLTGLTIDDITIGGGDVIGMKNVVVTFNNVISNHTISAEFTSAPNPPGKDK